MLPMQQTPMQFVSTRGATAPTRLSQAVLAGLAPDGGLFVPQRVPQLEGLALAGTLQEVAKRVLAPFFVGDALAPQLDALVEESFTFEAPLVALRSPRTFALELFHGPTSAFKDFGARFLAAVLARLAPAGGRPVTVLVATSGDTGSAVAAAFHRMPGVRVVILYPEGKVSARQAHQLGCFGDNVEAYRVQGDFDDCQRLVKGAFGDERLRGAVALASANSISLGRLLPQVAYHAHAALTHQRAHGTALNLVVPTGNLGNGVACVLARLLGAPVGDIVFATNANTAVKRALASPQWSPLPTVATLANAMDVGNPSNLERLRTLLPGLEGLRAQEVSDDDIRAQIRDGEAREGEVWCPHTACAVEVLARLRAAGDARPWAVVATAHPAKFETVVEPLVGHAVPVPPALAQLLARPARAAQLEPSAEALAAVLRAAPH
jgi:threonine synthase